MGKASVPLISTLRTVGGGAGVKLFFFFSQQRQKILPNYLLSLLSGTTALSLQAQRNGRLCCTCSGPHRLTQPLRLASLRSSPFPRRAQQLLSAGRAEQSGAPPLSLCAKPNRPGSAASCGADHPPEPFNMFGMIRNSLFGTAEVWPCRVLNKGEKDDVAYEERTYEGGMFASVELSGKPFDEALREAVLKLLKYVGGSNNQGAGMGMMAPVCSTVFPAEDGLLQHKVKVLLRIPSQFQDNPPSPSDESIQVEKREEMVVYSTQFGGYAKEADYVNYAAKLTSALGNEASFCKDFYFCNGYDPPMKPYGRRNEVWLLKK